VPTATLRMLLRMKDNHLLGSPGSFVDHGISGTGADPASFLYLFFNAFDLILKLPCLGSSSPIPLAGILSSFESQPLWHSLFEDCCMRMLQFFFSKIVVFELLSLHNCNHVGIYSLSLGLACSERGLALPRSLQPAQPVRYRMFLNGIGLRDEIYGKEHQSKL
jgi:hypothetical protein